MAGKESVSDILAKAKKKYGFQAGSAADILEEVRGLTTGNMAIDYITGVGGIPVGRVTEMYGLESSGKTTCATMTAVNLQRDIIANNRDEHIVYLDFEHAFEEEYAQALGLDTEHESFILAQPIWLEKGAEFILDVISTGTVRLAIFDSVAEMTPKATLEGEFDQRMGAMNRARLMKELLQNLTPLIHEHECAAVFLNHLMEEPNVSGGRAGAPPKETSPGGKGLKYYASLRMSYKQIGIVRSKALDLLTLEDGNQVAAVDTKVKVTKNKVGNPFREAKVRVRFGQGFDNFWTAYEILDAHNGMVIQSPGYHFFDTRTPELVHPDMPRQVGGSQRPYIQGKDNVVKFADSHPQWRQLFIDVAKGVLDKATTEPAKDITYLEEIEDE